MKNQETENKEYSLFDAAGSTALMPSFFGVCLLLTFGITGNTTYLVYASYLSIVILLLLAYIFILLGVQLGFYTCIDVEMEIDFSILLVYCAYLIFTLSLCAFTIFS